MSLTLLVLLPFIASVMAALLPSDARNTESTLAGLVALWCCVQTALYFPQIAEGGVLREEIQWLPALGLNLVLRMDGFAWMFSMLVLSIFGPKNPQVSYSGPLTSLPSICTRRSQRIGHEMQELLRTRCLSANVSPLTACASLKCPYLKLCVGSALVAFALLTSPALPDSLAGHQRAAAASHRPAPPAKSPDC